MAGWGSFEDEGVVDPWRVGAGRRPARGVACDRVAEEKGFRYILHFLSVRKPTPHLFFQLNLLLVLWVPNEKWKLMIFVCHV